MNWIVAKLLPFSKHGILLKQNGDTLTASGLREDVDIGSLQTDLEANWLDLAKREATSRIKIALAAAGEGIRPAGFNDLTTKLQLGRIKTEEQQILNTYYDVLEALEQEAATLQAKIEKAKSVEALNKISWPEWVRWEALPTRIRLEAPPTNEGQTKPEPSNK